VRQLSSGFTWFGKFVAPLLWIAVMGWAAFELFFHPAAVVFKGVPGGAPPGAKWVFLIAWLVVGAGVVRQALRLKRVRVDGDYLRISNYFTETCIPLETLVDVQQRGWLNGLITLEFADPNPFHGVVQFYPVRSSRLLVERDEAIVTELRRLAHFDASGSDQRAV
jgi:hypothetical protein